MRALETGVESSHRPFLFSMGVSISPSLKTVSEYGLFNTYEMRWTKQDVQTLF